MEQIFSNYPWVEYVLAGLGIFLSGFIISKIIRYSLNRIYNNTAKSKSDLTNIRFLKNGVSLIVFTICVILVLYTIPQFKKIGVTLFAGAGVLTIVIGFASQKAFSNIVSGIFIVLFRPFRVGDIIDVNGKTGVVEDITLRHTVINNFENKRIIIPNDIISSETIVNWSILDEKVCNHINMEISYESDVDVALQIMKEEAERHRFIVDGGLRPGQSKPDEDIKVKVVGYGESSVMLRVWVWTLNPFDGIELKFDLYKSIKARFDKSNIEIPYPHRTITYKK